MFMHGYEKNIEYMKITKEEIEKLASKPQGIKINQMLSVKNIVDENNTKVFFIGEIHDNFAHHYNQLNFIKELHKKYKYIAIGMEMFQKPFQSVLNDYIDGKISEIEMLEKTEYFDRWRFDFKLYKPILDYAKKNRIKIIALNVPKEITKKISSEGLDNVTDKTYLASHLDFSNKEYENFLRKIFNRHKMSKKFEYFYQAQVAWDETMAESAANFIKNNHDYALIVIAGNGHLRYGYGIPDRFKRRTNVPFLTVLQDEDIKENIADYVLFPDEINIKPTMKLGVMAEETEKGLQISEIIPKSLAENANLKKGDIILKIEGKIINDISDLKLMLYKLDNENKKEFDILVNRRNKKKIIRVIKN
jgi:uncharacterized iron-regulated protein